MNRRRKVRYLTKQSYIRFLQIWENYRIRFSDHCIRISDDYGTSVVFFIRLKDFDTNSRNREVRQKIFECFPLLNWKINTTKKYF